ncbi:MULTISPECIES: DNA-3-methyladenine glycosylase 2 [unclassified Comamonas]|jgi:DNA-3-methyladenine glycosylase II|uniref:DNA-3-methyladenine glycosylase II n=1 Tax=Comamonas squillarum TaxID=2977320 RepID=A0ABY5ZYA4_9BURK|nr:MULTISPECIES: DNA-3-methyladenine glycosylase 2 [unclassified Comamonas]PWB20494.1 3-methyladenine DNA glycosylase 2 [Comamonas sp. JNW]UXC18423.1 DNA-3-methyladenine glycosylase 2 [Comamonas sp. PR12]
MPLPLTTQVALPANYRPQDMLALHARDALQASEKVEGLRVSKGLVWQGQPALLQLEMVDGASRAVASLAVDGTAPTGNDPAALDAMLARMLGLGDGADQLALQHGKHPVLGPLLLGQMGLRVPASSSPFEALVWAITGQQISVAAAIALRRRLIAAAAVQHSSGMLCHPDAAALAALTPEQLRAAGFSVSKIATLERVCAAVLDGSLPLDAWAAQPLQAQDAQAIEDALLAIKGIGPWTVHYALLRGFGWLDGSLHGDVAVRNALARLLDVPSVSQREAEQWLGAFAPWRALVAAHLWASLSAKSY